MWEKFFWSRFPVQVSRLSSINYARLEFWTLFLTEQWDSIMIWSGLRKIQNRGHDLKPLKLQRDVTSIILFGVNYELLLFWTSHLHLIRMIFISQVRLNKYERSPEQTAFVKRVHCLREYVSRLRRQGCNWGWIEIRCTYSQNYWLQSTSGSSIVHMVTCVSQGLNDFQKRNLATRPNPDQTFVSRASGCVTSGLSIAQTSCCNPAKQ